MDTANLKVRLHPRAPRAFIAALIRGKGEEDDTIWVNVTYKSIARHEKTLRIPLRVRFEPWPPIVAAMAVAGAVLGWGLLVLVKAKNESWSGRFRILAAAAAAGFLVEIVAMLLELAGNGVTLFHQKSDPFQFLPATLIGVICGLAGYQSRDLLRRIGNIRWFQWLKPGPTCIALAFVGAPAVLAIEPSAITALRSGDLAIVSTARGIEKISGDKRTQIVQGFGQFEAADLAALPGAGGDGFLVSLQIRTRTNTPFARLRRYDATGRQTAEWRLGDVSGVLSSIAVDRRGQFAWCSDSRLNTIYRLDLTKPGASFVRIATLRHAGILGPLALDEKRGQLLVADVEKGAIFSIALDTGSVQAVLEAGTVWEPLSMVIDPTLDRLYIADGLRGGVWMAVRVGNKWTVKPFPASQELDRPASLAMTPGGSLWVADRFKSKIWLFRPDGRTLRAVTP